MNRSLNFTRTIRLLMRGFQHAQKSWRRDPDVLPVHVIELVEKPFRFNIFSFRFFVFSRGYSAKIFEPGPKSVPHLLIERLLSVVLEQVGSGRIQLRALQLGFEYDCTHAFQNAATEWMQSPQSFRRVLTVGQPRTFQGNYPTIFVQHLQTRPYG